MSTWADVVKYIFSKEIFQIKYTIICQFLAKMFEYVFFFLLEPANTQLSGFCTK